MYASTKALSLYPPHKGGYIARGNLSAEEGILTEGVSANKPYLKRVGLFSFAKNLAVSALPSDEGRGGVTEPRRGSESKTNGHTQGRRSRLRGVRGEAPRRRRSRRGREAHGAREARPPKKGGSWGRHAPKQGRRGGRSPRA